MIRMQDHSPTRRARTMGLRLAIAAAAVLTGATIALSTGLSSSATQTQPVAQVQNEQRAEQPATAQPKPLKQVRVIELFNVPADQRRQ